MSPAIAMSSRRERDRVRRLAPTCVAGGLAGAALLLLTPSDFFETIAPFLILGACALFAAQPALSRALNSGADRPRHEPLASRSPLVVPARVRLPGLRLRQLFRRRSRGDPPRGPRAPPRGEPAARERAAAACSPCSSTRWPWSSSPSQLTSPGPTPRCWRCRAWWAATSGRHLAQRLPVPASLRTAVVLLGLAASAKLLVG